MYRTSWDRSTISAEGAQRISASTVLSSTSRSLHGRCLGRGSLGDATTSIAVDQPGEGHHKVGGAGQGGGVDALRDVVGGVVPGGQVALRIRRAQSDRSHPTDAWGKGVVEEGVADRHGAATIRDTGGSEGLAELDQLPVVGQADHRALADLVGDLSEGDRVDVEEGGGASVELLAMAADERPTAFAEGLLGAGQDDPDVEVLRGVGGQLIGGGENGRDSRGVVV